MVSGGEQQLACVRTLQSLGGRERWPLPSGYRSPKSIFLAVLLVEAAGVELSHAT